jgi:hypothetical protein
MWWELKLVDGTKHSKLVRSASVRGVECAFAVAAPSLRFVPAQPTDSHLTHVRSDRERLLAPSFPLPLLLVQRVKRGRHRVSVANPSAPSLFSDRLGAKKEGGPRIHRLDVYSVGSFLPRARSCSSSLGGGAARVCLGELSPLRLGLLSDDGEALVLAVTEPPNYTRLSRKSSNGRTI